jgi:hypothetical protein
MVTVVAFVACHVSVEDCPAVIVVGFADKVIVGAGGGGGGGGGGGAGVGAGGGGGGGTGFLHEKDTKATSSNKCDRFPEFRPSHSLNLQSCYGM